MTSIPNSEFIESAWPEVSEDIWDDLPHPTSRLRTILGRAAVVYLGMFLGISLLLSVLGVDPLTHNGLIPQCLLVYVGFMVLVALANGDDENLINEQVRSRLALFACWPRHEPLPEKKV